MQRDTAKASRPAEIKKPAPDFGAIRTLALACSGKETGNQTFFPTRTKESAVAAGANSCPKGCFSHSRRPAGLDAEDGIGRTPAEKCCHNGYDSDPPDPFPGQFSWTNQRK